MVPRNTLSISRIGGSGCEGIALDSVGVALEKYFYKIWRTVYCVLWSDAVYAVVMFFLLMFFILSYPATYEKPVPLVLRYAASLAPVQD